MALTSNKSVLKWVDEMVALTKPDKVVWIDGSEEQLEALRAEACSTGEMISSTRKSCPAAICTVPRSTMWPVWRAVPSSAPGRKRTPAPPTTGWTPRRAYAKLGKLLTGAMKGRTMYVIPYSMAHVGSPFAKVGIELTDSIYVVLNMAIMTRVGQKVLDALGDHRLMCQGPACQGGSRRGEPLHRPLPGGQHHHERQLRLRRQCAAGQKVLRPAHRLLPGQNEGWMAEHMLILGIENPQGEAKYVAAAFPSACGKTNLAMLIPPKAYRREGLQGLVRGRRYRLAAYRP